MLAWRIRQTRMPNCCNKDMCSGFREENVYFYLHLDCLRRKQPYFNPQMVVVPCKVYQHLQPEHICLLQQFGVLVWWILHANISNSYLHQSWTRTFTVSSFVVQFENYACQSQLQLYFLFLGEIWTIESRRQLGYRYQTMFKFVHLQKSHAKITYENLLGNTREYSGTN